MKKHSINITYVEGLLVLANAVSVSALHNQYTTLVSQNELINKLSGDVNRLNQELVSIKITSKSVGNSVITNETTQGLLDIPFVNYKVLAGLVGCGIVYYGSSVVLAKLPSLLLPSIKTLGGSFKALLGVLPLVTTDLSAEVIKNGITYRVKAEGDTITNLEFRSKDSEFFESVADQVQKSVEIGTEPVGPESSSDTIAYKNLLSEKEHTKNSSDHDDTSSTDTAAVDNTNSVDTASNTDPDLGSTVSETLCDAASKSESLQCISALSDTMSNLIN